LAVMKMGKTTAPTLGIKVRCRAFPGLRFEDPNDAARPVRATPAADLVYWDVA
jgi:hypothetical protein